MRQMPPYQEWDTVIPAIVGNIPPEEFEAAYYAQHQPNKTGAINR